MTITNPNRDINSSFTPFGKQNPFKLKCIDVGGGAATSSQTGSQLVTQMGGQLVFGKLAHAFRDSWTQSRSPGTEQPRRVVLQSPSKLENMDTHAYA